MGARMTQPAGSPATPGTASPGDRHPVGGSGAFTSAPRPSTHRAASHGSTRSSRSCSQPSWSPSGPQRCVRCTARPHGCPTRYRRRRRHRRDTLRPRSRPSTPQPSCARATAPGGLPCGPISSRPSGEHERWLTRPGHAKAAPSHRWRCGRAAPGDPTAAAGPRGLEPGPRRGGLGDRTRAAGVAPRTP